MNIKEAKGLYKDNKPVGAIVLFDDDAVGIYLKDKCYVTKEKQKTIYWISQAWYSSLVPSLQIRRLYGSSDGEEKMVEEKESYKSIKHRGLLRDDDRYQG